MEDSDEFLDLLHLASSLVDPKSGQAASDRLRAAMPAALNAMANAPIDQIVEFLRSARAAGVRFVGSDEGVAAAIKRRSRS